MADVVYHTQEKYIFFSPQTHGRIGPCRERVREREGECVYCVLCAAQLYAQFAGVFASTTFMRCDRVSIYFLFKFILVFFRIWESSSTSKVENLRKDEINWLAQAGEMNDKKNTNA